jgi:gamma-glutamyltranspeptidase
VIACLALSSPVAVSTEAGVAAFRSGGNALDAALATAASLTVTTPDNCSLGGDLFAIVRQPAGDVLVVNASGPAASSVIADEVRARYGAEMPIVGAQTVTVPGVVAGWESLWACGARLPWADHFDVAIAQALEGVPLVSSAAESLTRNADLFSRDPGMRALFYANDRPLEAGDILRQPQLADTLAEIAEDGARAFYEGDIALRWLDYVRGHGSVLEAGDLAGYRPEIAEPHKAGWNRFDIYTAPPNSQGFLLPLILNAATQADEVSDPLSTAAPQVAAAFRAAAETRAQRLADPAFAEISVDSLESPQPTARGGARARGDTVAVVAADGEERAVCLIQSVFHAFGAGMLDPDTGIVAQNRGASFSLDPDSPNVLAPSKRPAHTLSPTLVEEGGRLRVVLGTMGGLIQPQALAQILMHLAAGMACHSAVEAPRFVVGGMEAGSSPDDLLAEDRVPTLAQAALEAAGWCVTKLPSPATEVGVAQVITCDELGSYATASDPRSDGMAWTCPAMH